ncbi:MAG: cytochrome c [Gammaproteobacteria bacterium]|nr:cytochrome c [Gammaproteobacteria bacterium]
MPAKLRTIAALFMATTFACSAEMLGADSVAERWYTPDDVANGKALFLSHCASCHGSSAEGTTAWRTTDANGNYPPPPLNGSAHGWHHALSSLEQTITIGGAQYGGVMPGFGETLDEDEVRTTIAYFQSFWSNEIYARWQKVNNQ